MTTQAATCARFQGVAQIFRFNWPFYAIGSCALIAAGALLLATALPRWIDWTFGAGIGLAGFWLSASLIVSHIIYDRSPLREWKWITPALGFVPRRWINIHCGLDESTPALR